jgi:hypothetical protein
VVDCFVQFFDLVLPREPLAVVRLMSHFLEARLAWSNGDGTPRAPREILRIEELQRQVALDRKSVVAGLRASCAARYLEPVELPRERGGGYGFRLKLDLERFTLDPGEFQGFYPVPTHRIKVPLAFFQTVVPQETLSVVKVVACIIRHTLGSIDNVGLEVGPAISQQKFVREMSMGRRQAILGVQGALARGYIRRYEQGSLASGRPSTYGLYWRQGQGALAYGGGPAALPVALEQALGREEREKGIREVGKRDQESGKKGSGGGEKGIGRMGKRDQDGGKKGSGAPVPTDLIKDLDLDLRSSSSGDPEEVRTPKPAADPDLFEAVRLVFPNGNPKLIRRFLDERPRYVGELLGLLARDELDPAFVRRFTRSSDPKWAVFHTLCTTGQALPRRPQPPAVRPRAAPVERDDWEGLDFAAKRARLLALWRQAAGWFLERPPEEAEELPIAEVLEAALRAGAPRAELEQIAFDDVNRRRGRPLGAPSEAPPGRAG